MMTNSTYTKEKLITILIKLYPESSKRTLQSWIVHKRIQVDGQVVKKPHFMVGENQKITLLKKDLAPLPIIYKDHYMIVVDKPAGLLSVPKDHSVERNVLDVLRRYFGDENIFQVHRLDQKTSGLILFARSKDAAKTLSKAFKEHKIQRIYYAVCEGSFEEDKGTIESYISEMKNLSMVSSQDPTSGKKAITHFEVIKKSPFTSHVQLSLETGKKHQIRLHLKDLGHPVIADKRYGSLIDPIKRLCLHATKLIVSHPETEKEMIFESPVPPTFKKL